jgi:hypothetical protein
MTGLSLTSGAPPINPGAPDTPLISAAIGDPSIDQADAINGELARLGPGGTLILPAGTYAIGSAIRLLPGQTLLGRGAALVPLGMLDAMVETTGTSTISGVLLQNVRGLATTAVHAAGGAGSVVNVLSDTVIGFDVGVQVASGGFDIENGFFLNDGVAVSSAAAVDTGTIRANYVLGGSGLDLAGTGSGTDIVSNIILPGVAGAYGIRVEAGSGIRIRNNVVDQIISGPGIVIAPTQGPVASVTISDNYVGANLYATAATNGIQISGTVGTTVAFNTVVGWSGYDLDVSGASGIQIAGNNLSSVTAAGNVRLESVAGATLVGNVLESTNASIVESGSTRSTDIGNTLASEPSYTDLSVHVANRGGQGETALTGAELSTALSQYSEALATLPDVRSPSAIMGLAPLGAATLEPGQGDNAAAINAALAALPRGGTLVLGPGTYSIGSSINLNGRILVGTEATLTPSAAMASLIVIEGGFSTVAGLRLSNQAGLAAAAITVAKPADNLPTSIEKNIITGFSRGIAVEGDNFSVEDNTLTDNATGVYLGSYTLNGRVTGNHIAGGTGIDLEGGAQQPEGVDISSNVIDPDGLGSYGILIRSGLSIQVTGNTIGHIVSASGVMLDATQAPVAYVSVQGNFIGGEADQDESDGVTVTGNVTNTVIAQNRLVGLSGYGVQAFGANKLYLSGNTFDSAGKPGNIFLQDVANATVVGNVLGSSEHPIVQAGSMVAVEIGDFQSSLIVAENSSATPLGMPTPNGSNSTITVTGLPGNGLVTHADGRPLAIGDALSADDFSALDFTPAPGAFGQSSDFRYRVTDDAGNAYVADMKLSIGPAIGNPVVATQDVTAAGSSAVALGIAAPMDPNYASADLHIAVSALPSNGRVALANGNAVSVGAVLTSGELSGLSFTPASTSFGQRSVFTYTVSDPAGNTSTGTVGISVAPSPNGGSSADTAQPVIDPDLRGSFAVTDVTGHSGGSNGTAYDGPLDYLQRQFIWTGAESVAVRADVPSVFLHGGAGADALQVTAGRNVLDGGSGSNFLVGSTGADGNSDVFFLDERSAADTWSTLVSFHPGDEATIWGYQPGISTFSWSAWAGADGFKGATLHFDISGLGSNANAALTFAGITQQTAASAFTMDTGAVDGNSYLHIAYTGA